MSFTLARPYVPPSGGSQTGIRASCSKIKSGDYIIRLSISQKVKEELFEQVDSEDMFAIEIGRGADHGKLRINKSDEGRFQFLKGIKGSIWFKIKKPDTIPDLECKMMDCHIIGPENGIVIRLPEWAQARLKADNGVTLP